MSLIDSLVNCSDARLALFPCPAPNKAASLPRVEMPSFHFHERKKQGPKRTHGHTGDLSIPLIPLKTSLECTCVCTCICTDTPLLYR